MTIQVQTTYIGISEDIEAALTRVVAPLVERIRDLEIKFGSKKHVYTVKETALQMGYSAEMVRRFIRDGKMSRKDKLVFLKAKEVTKGDYRISPADLDTFLSHF